MREERGGGKTGKRETGEGKYRVQTKGNFRTQEDGAEGGKRKT